MSMKVWMYMSAFSSSATFTILGITERRFEFVAIGVLIGVAFYFIRKKLH